MTTTPREEGRLLTWKRTLAALAVLAALVAIVWFVEVRLEQARFERESREARIFPFSSSDVASLEVRVPGETIRLARAEDPGPDGKPVWEVVAPVQAPASSRTVGGLLWLVDSLRRLETLPEDASGGDFGLDGERVRTLTAAGPGGEEVRLEIGLEVPTQPAVYARVGGGPVVLVDRRALLALDVDLMRLRDLRLVRFQSHQVLRMEWQRPEPWGLLAVSIAPSTDAGWRLEEPVAAPADSERVLGVADTLAKIRAHEVVAERGDSEGRLPEFGLDPPRSVARIETRDGVVHEIAFGALAPSPPPQPVEEGAQPKPTRYRIYARNDTGAVFVIQGEWMRKVNTPAIEWRERRLARVDRWNLLEMIVKGGGGENWTFRRDAERAWTCDQAPDRAFTWEEFDPHLDNLMKLRFVSFPRPGEPPNDGAFEKPYLRVEFRTEEGETWYELGARHTNPNLRHARVSGGEEGLVLYGDGARALRQLHKLLEEGSGLSFLLRPKGEKRDLTPSGDKTTPGLPGTGAARAYLRQEETSCCGL